MQLLIAAHIYSLSVNGINIVYLFCGWLTHLLDTTYVFRVALKIYGTILATM